MFNTGKVGSNSDGVFFFRRSLAAYLGVSMRTLDRWDAAGHLPEGRRIGKRRAWLRRDIESWVAEDPSATVPLTLLESSRI